MNDPRWIAVLPFKGGSASKSRLMSADLEAGPTRSELARAFLFDTALAIAPTVSQFVLVFPNGAIARELADLLEPLPVDYVLDAGDGLNAAVTAGIEKARAGEPECWVVVLTADLAALRTADLREALLQAQEHLRSVVADREGTGTTTLMFAPGTPVESSFGEGSFVRHRALGFVPLDIDAGSSLRLDIDVATDLEAARLRGLGPHTKALL